MAGWTEPADERAERLAFVVDVVGYGQRGAGAQERIQDRLQALLRAVVADVGDDFDRVDRDSGSGDGLVVLLPTSDDPGRRLPTLVRSVARRLAEDNRAATDRIRLRMAVGTGLVARNGLAGPLVVNISRLVDSEPLRRAVAGHPDADLAVLALNGLCRGVVASGCLPLVPDRVERVELVDVAMRAFEERAWLWVSRPHGR